MKIENPTKDLREIRIEIVINAICPAEDLKARVACFEAVVENATAIGFNSGRIEFQAAMRRRKENQPAAQFAMIDALFEAAEALGKEYPDPFGKDKEAFEAAADEKAQELKQKFGSF